MRLNQYLARHTGISRRAADKAIADNRVLVNGLSASLGQIVSDTDVISLDNGVIAPDVKTQTLMLNKPIGYVCSRLGQGSKTIYDLLPKELHHLKSVGRLDKDSSGLILMTNDGNLADQLTHPRYEKEKVYEVTLNKDLSETDTHTLIQGLKLSDGPSKFISLDTLQDKKYRIKIAEGRNRQIRRTFNAIGYEIIGLHRIKFGDHELDSLKSGEWKQI